MRTLVFGAVAFAALSISNPALAAPGDPVKLDSAFTLDPIIDGRVRLETVDTPTLDADALTLRIRAGAELKHGSGLSLLAEGMGTVALDQTYNAFPFAVADSQRRPGYAVVADPMNVGLGRLQLQYKSKPLTVTLGRQRVNLDDQRWVGSVGWRQNEQTFDGVRSEAELGPVGLDATYTISQRTIFGSDAGARAAYNGHFVFLGAKGKLGPANFAAFAYLLDYNPAAQVGTLAAANADTQTYGLRAATPFKLVPGSVLNLTASFARQSAWKQNLANYSADYIAFEAGLSRGPINLMAGYELLGSDQGHAVQTPMATLHKFNGWADLFPTTPVGGLTDWYGGGAIKFPRVKGFPALTAGIIFHRFESDVGKLHYGDEWDASLGFKAGRANLLAKFADYKADGFGADTRKVWLQVEFSY